MIRSFLLLVISLALAMPLPADPRAPVRDTATLALLHFDQLPVRNDGLLPIGLEGGTPELVEGRFGKALDARAGEPVLFRLPIAAQPKTTLTVECWVKLVGESEERLQRIVGRSSNFGFYSTRGGRLTWFVMAKEWKSVPGKLEVGKWTHLAGTFDGKKMQLYIDGKLAGEAENPGELRQGPGDFFLGSEAGRDEHRFGGLIDEVRLSKVVRTGFMTGEALPPPTPTTTFQPQALDENAFTHTLVVPRAATKPAIDGTLDDPAWQPLPAIPFVTTRQGGSPDTPTWVKATWDERALYLAYRCFEKGQETQRTGPAEHDNMEIFRADGVEALLQPGGPGKPYYQLAMNAEGGLFDIMYKLGPKKQLAWDGDGIRVAGRREADAWTVEVGIPFAALGNPAPKGGDEWRANFCRCERPSRELTAWSPTGGGFHVLKRFGILRFAHNAAAAKKDAGGMCELRGTVVDAQGVPLAAVPVRSLTGRARTDIFGEFVLRALPPGEVALEIRSPRYQRTTGMVKVAQAKEILAPLALTAIDPYQAEFTMPGDGLVWLPSSIDEPPSLSEAPAETAKGLSLLATPGEYESRAVAFLAKADLGAPAAALSDLVAPTGARISGGQIQVRWTQRLLKRVQYTRPREDAVWNWRFLWPEAPESVKAGQLRQLVVTVKVPDDTPAGVYSGTLAVRGNGTAVASLPVTLRVAACKLDPTRRRIGPYYGIRGVSPEQKRIEMQDLKEHGCNMLLWHEHVWYNKPGEGRPEFIIGNIREAIEIQKEAGLGPPFIVDPSPLRAADVAGIKREMTPEYAQAVLASKEFRRIYGEGIRQLQALEKELGAGEFVYTWMDEVLNEGRYAAWEAFAKITRELCDNRIYITFHNRKQEPIDRMAPWMDVRCYHGHTLDWWQDEGHDWQELADELKADGDEAWCYYNIREIAVTSEWVRLCNGYWLWRSPLDGHVPWKYYSYGNNPFDDLDSDRHDFAYAAPHSTRPEMVSTLEWECFREGADDLRYLETLDNRLKALTKSNAPAVKAARTFRQQLWDFGSKVPDLAARLTATDYATRREGLVKHLEALDALARAQ
jgi:hypothetical protein